MYSDSLLVLIKLYLIFFTEYFLLFRLYFKGQNSPLILPCCKVQCVDMSGFMNTVLRKLKVGGISIQRKFSLSALLSLIWSTLFIA